MEVFTQFSSDLDENTKEQLTYGKGLMELLKQPLYHPLTMAEQVITLVAATNKLFLNIDVKKIKQTQADMLTYFKDAHKDIVSELEDKKTLTDELKERILEAAGEFMKRVE
jgi:F-type H+-transporting ATPase subunit alpha